MDLWNSLDGFEQTLFAIGAITLVFFAVQTALSLLIGVDADVDLDTEFDAGGESGFDVFELFTIRNTITFLTGFSWTTLGLLQMDWSAWFAVPLGFFVGSSVTWLNLTILGLVASLQTSGNVDLRAAIGSEATVTLRVPGAEQGEGKVNLSFAGRQLETVATTHHAADIPRGDSVRVIAIVGDKVLIEPTQ